MQARYLIPLLLAGITSTYYMLQVKNQTHLTPKTTTINSISSTISLYSFNKMGRLIKELHAESCVTHTNHNAVFSYPRLTLYSIKNQRWVISANRAKTQAKHHTTLATGHVIISQRLQNKTLSTIYTSRITYDMKHNTLYTAAPVKIIRAHTSTTGTGLFINLTKNTYKILSSTHILYHPEETNT